MKRNIVKIAAVVAATVGVGASVQALPFISGSVDMIGTAKLNSQVLFNATAVTSITGSSVDNGSGSYTQPGIDSPSVTWAGFTFNPGGPTSVNPLWTFTDMGKTYDFDLASITSSHSTVAGTEFLNLSGKGTAQITGFADTAGTWTLTISSASGHSENYKFGFQSTTTAVPEGGTTLMLLGSALSGLGLLRKKLSI